MCRLLVSVNVDGMRRDVQRKLKQRHCRNSRSVTRSRFDDFDDLGYSFR